MLKRYLVVFVAGFVSPLVFALYLGGENLAQAGLRLAAIEEGFALAQRHWQFTATPEHDAELLAQAEPAPTKKKTERRR